MKGFIKLNRSQELLSILQNAPDCFLLLSLIAIRARRTDEITWDGLEIGEAKLGDYKACGLTRARYRAALDKLKSNHQITIRTTNKGTIAKLCNTAIYDINTKTKNHQDNQQLTNKKPSGNQQTTTNKNVKNNKEGKETDGEYLEFFKEFWLAYPRKLLMDNAQLIFEKLWESGTINEGIVRIAKKYAKLCELEEREKSKIKYASNWLRDGGYKDDYDSELKPYIEEKKKEEEKENVGWLEKVGHDNFWNWPNPGMPPKKMRPGQTYPDQKDIDQRRPNF